jgi:hypothetical protein
MNFKTLLVAGFAASLLVTACGKKEAPPPETTTTMMLTTTTTTVPVAAPVSFRAVQLGNSLGDGKKIVSPTNSFAPKDTIYAVVETEGSGKANLKAVWTFHKGDKSTAVSEATQTIDATGPAFTEFHVAKPSGWPVGDYKVEIFLNDSSVGSQTFTVK